MLVQAIRLMAPEQEIRLSFRGFPRNPSGWPVLLDALSQQKNFKSLNIEFDEVGAQEDIEGMTALLAGTLTPEQLEINVVPADDDEIPVLDWQGFFDALRCNRSLKKLDINYRSLKVVNVHSVNGNAKFFADLFQALASNSTLEHLALHDENFQHGCVSTRALANLLDVNKLIRVSGFKLCPLNADPFSRSCGDAREGVINLKSIDLDWNTGTKNFIELFKGRQSGAFVQVGDFRWRCEDSALKIRIPSWNDKVMWEESLQDFLAWLPSLNEIYGVSALILDTFGHKLPTTACSALAEFLASNQSLHTFSLGSRHSSKKNVVLLAAGLASNTWLQCVDLGSIRDDADFYADNKDHPLWEDIRPYYRAIRSPYVNYRDDAIDQRIRDNTELADLLSGPVADAFGVLPPSETQLPPEVGEIILRKLALTPEGMATVRSLDELMKPFA